MEIESTGKERQHRTCRDSSRQRAATPQGTVRPLIKRVHLYIFDLEDIKGDGG